MSIPKKKKNPNAVIRMTEKELNMKKAKWTSDAIDLVTIYACWVLHDEFGFGEKRLEKFTKYLRETKRFDNESRLTVQRIADQLREETGFGFILARKKG